MPSLKMVCLPVIFYFTLSLLNLDVVDLLLLISKQECTGIAILRWTKSEFTVEFSVSDSQGVIKGSVNIQVGDVNDNAPRFHNQPYSVRIPEANMVCSQAKTKHFGNKQLWTIINFYNRIQDIRECFSTFKAPLV
uniref:Uncharacterized protein n=1 Tax=Sphaerodactylus townsendi TaxID=933632 RepID=A0ACB8F8N6_9SAUR